jgi:hypothetical protein
MKFNQAEISLEIFMLLSGSTYCKSAFIENLKEAKNNLI